MSTVVPGSPQLSLAEAISASDALVMHGALSEVEKLRGVVQSAGMLSLRELVGKPERSTTRLDQVTSLGQASLRKAVDTAAQTIMEAPLPPGVSNRYIRVSGRLIYLAGKDGVIEMGNLLALIPEVFESRNGKKITEEEHDAIARHSFGTAQRIANKNAIVAGDLFEHLKLRPGKFSPFDPRRFTIEKGPEGLRLAVADPEELKRVIAEARERSARVVPPLAPGRQCPALAIRNEETNLVKATWDLMIDIQTAARTVTPADRALWFVTGRIGRLANRLGL